MQENKYNTKTAQYSAYKKSIEEQITNNSVFSFTMLGLYSIYRRFFDFYYNYQMFYNSYWHHAYYNISDQNHIGDFMKNTVDNFLSAYEGYLDGGREFSIENYNFDLFLCYIISYLVTTGILGLYSSISDFLTSFHNLIDKWDLFRSSLEDISNALRISLLKKREYKQVTFSKEDAASIYAFISTFASFHDDSVYDTVMNNSISFRRRKVNL